MAPPRFLRNLLRSRGRNSSSNKVQPTAYPRVLFHMVRCAQLVSSAIVVAVMAFFISQLAMDGYAAPWTFLLLATVSILTMLSLSLTILAHCFFGLNPQFNLLLNGILTLLWSLSFGMLAWWSSGTLGHVCSVARWKSDDGVMVCRVYKALFAFAMVGFISTLAALLLDLHVFKRATQRGTYNAMLDYETKRDAVPIHPLSNPSQSHSSNDNPFDANIESHFDDSDDEDAHHGGRKFGGAKRQYAQPEAGRMLEDYPHQQYTYDTGYHGVHGDMGRR